MSSNTAILFPGLDALFITKKLRLWIGVPAVQQKLAEASSYLSTLTGLDEDLLSFVKNTNRPHIADFDRTLIILTTLQVSIAEQLAEITEWDIIQGCSHGDIARNVISDVLSFKDALDIVWYFSQLRKICPEGYTASIRSTNTNNFSSSQLAWIKDSGANLSRWSERHGTVGGTKNFIEKMAIEAVAQDLKIKPILSYPVHSKAMEPIVPEMMKHQNKWAFKDTDKKIFSSLWLRYIKTGQEIFEEGLAGATSPVLWLETLSALCHEEQVGTFINVGPSNTLTAWLLESDSFKHLKVLDAWELLNPKGDS